MYRRSSAGHHMQTETDRRVHAGLLWPLVTFLPCWSWPEWSHVEVTPETVKLKVQHEQNRNVEASKRGSCDMFPFSVSWDPRPGLRTVNERNIDLSCQGGLLHFSSGLDFIALFSHCVKGQFGT